MAVRQYFRLHEEIAKGGRLSIGHRGRQHDLSIRCDLDFPPRPRAISDTNPPQLDIILGRYGNFGMGIEIQIPPAELDPSLPSASG